jgi:hypothetical protein
MICLKLFWLMMNQEESFQFKFSVFNYYKNNRVSIPLKCDYTAMHLVKRWIITTDADCGSRKLAIDIGQLHSKRSMIAGAVTYDCKTRSYINFQQLDLAEPTRSNYR